MFLGIGLLICYILFIFLIIEKIYSGNLFYLFFYLLFFLPIYTVFQLLIFKTTQNTLLIDLLKYSKDFIIYSSFLIFVIGYKKKLIDINFKITFLDKLVLLFSIISIFYCLVPLGEATFFAKAVYLKNILLIGIVYFFGRNIEIDSKKFRFIKKSIITVFLFAFIISTFEFLTGVHLHSLLDYGNYNFVLNGIEPSGNYGLSWSFERASDRPRFASFFSDPLEFSSSLLLFLSIPLYALIHNSKGLNFNLLILFLISISFFYAYTRASIISAFLMIFLALFISKNYKVLIKIFSLIFFSFFIFFIFSDEDSIYFILDTLMFRESSSLNHLLEWIQSIISIFENPFGIGLAMSGNASTVDESIKIGGENQFLIYGVQMGIISILVYLLILFYAISNSFYAYRNSQNFKKELCFIAGITKFGLLIPLITSNAELALYISLVSWLLIGSVQRILSKNLMERKFIN